MCPKVNFSLLFFFYTITHGHCTFGQGLSGCFANRPPRRREITGKTSGETGMNSGTGEGKSYIRLPLKTGPPGVS